SDEFCFRIASCHVTGRSAASDKAAGPIILNHNSRKSFGGRKMPKERVVKPGDVTQRVGVEVIRARGVDVEKLIRMLIANAGAEFASTYYYYTILRMHL